MELVGDLRIDLDRGYSLYGGSFQVRALGRDRSVVAVELAYLRVCVGAAVE